MKNNYSSKAGQGGYFEGDVQNTYTNEDGKNSQNKLQGGSYGLIPININMFNQAVINKDGDIVYNGKIIRDCVIVGYLIDYKELHENNTILVKIWDQTGTVQVTFHTNNEDGFIKGLNNIQFNG
jgi:DNA/RNA endonuclease YhcR with UshA esterase domain